MFTPVLFGAARPDAERRLVVLDGRVACVRLGQASIERCLECVYLVRMEHGDPMRVVCAASPQVERSRA